jgi:NitT/TauT family transport system ATP-binding protein
LTERGVLAIEASSIVLDLGEGKNRHRALDGVSLRVRAGEKLVIVGPSGSGKSSLLRAVIGLQKPLAGTVDPGVQPAEVGMLFQDDALLPWKTARDNVALGLEFRGCARNSALVQADYWLDRLGLHGFENRYPRHLSGGQRKRVALAQVLALMPKLLLMDEPFASLDAIVRARIVQDVASLVEEEGISVLLVTHDLEEAISLSDRVYLLSQGPRARITQEYRVSIPRPRDPVKARVHPAFAPLYEKLWNDLSHEVAFDQRAEAAE